MPWEDLSNALNRFVGRVRSDVQRLGFDPDHLVQQGL